MLNLTVLQKKRVNQILASHKVVKFNGFMTKGAIEVVSYNKKNNEYLRYRIQESGSVRLVTYFTGTEGFNDFFKTQVTAEDILKGAI